jgi:hypothetical protein
VDVLVQAAADLPVSTVVKLAAPAEIVELEKRVAGAAMCAFSVGFDWRYLEYPCAADVLVLPNSDHPTMPLHRR